MLKILTVVGARPQFVKAAMVSRALAAVGGTEERILHTGQHYDEAMSDVFFRQLALPRPYKNLAVGSGAHGAQTAAMLGGIEAELENWRPDWVLVYGDTNSTLAAALAAAKLHIPVAHVEAGLRSFNKRMPEEINRILTDHVSTLLFCPTQAAVEQLHREGIMVGVEAVGDVMYDAARFFGDHAAAHSTVLATLGLRQGSYSLATLHRAENTDDVRRLGRILRGLRRLAEAEPVVLPIHPRTRKVIQASGLADELKTLKIVDPVPFFDMLQLERHARVILTDSGGVQKEAYFFGRPCVTFRDETEWVETVNHGWNTLVGADDELLVKAARKAGVGTKISDYGDGQAAFAIAARLKKI